MADADKKTCIGCSELKPVSDFRVNSTKGRKSYRLNRCGPCESIYHRDRVKMKRQSPDWRHRRWITNLKSKYGLTKEQYVDMMLDQDFRCAICLKPQGAYFVDHDHACCNSERSCGKCVRSLTCRKCNTLLGQAEDDVNILRRAAEYLEAHSGKP